MNENEISYQIRQALFEVYFELGPGLLESSYEFALKHELETRGMHVQSQVELPLVYKNRTLEKVIGWSFIENKVIVEIKSVDLLSKMHHKQVITYLKLSKLKLGILVNFNTDYLKDSIFIKVNNLEE